MLLISISVPCCTAVRFQMPDTYQSVLLNHFCKICRFYFKCLVPETLHGETSGTKELDIKLPT